MKVKIGPLFVVNINGAEVDIADWSNKGTRTFKLPNPIPRSATGLLSSHVSHFFKTYVDFVAIISD